MQHCSRELFDYFQCASCKCIQIASIPDNLGNYYPEDYYSFSDVEIENYRPEKLGSFHKVQSDFLLKRKSQFLGKLFTIGYRPEPMFTWIRKLNIDENDKVLDVGCGSGLLLKKMYRLGFNQLMGVDPFIPESTVVGDQLKILKKSIFDLHDERFDYIMMHHSFEHMESPSTVLEQLNQLLKEDGKLLIRIPVVSEYFMNLYGTDLASLDAPRHLFIHSVQSMQRLASNAGFKIEEIEYDSDDFAFWASEQYKRDICLGAANSYAKSRKRSIFSKSEIKKFRSELRRLNEEGLSDNAAFYLSK